MAAAPMTWFCFSTLMSEPFKTFRSRSDVSGWDEPYSSASWLPAESYCQNFQFGDGFHGEVGGPFAPVFGLGVPATGSPYVTISQFAIHRSGSVLTTVL